ncbi:MAG TPA: hypothetical protein VN837_17075 [Chloroflexota bacterium]|nr:hypothetical protein [Chloroflexota bacterium]
MRVHRTVVLIALLALTLGQAGPTNATSARLPLPAAPNCPIFPATNVWNRDISRLPVATNSAQMIAAIGLGRGLHPDFSNQGAYGIPFQVVSGSQKKSPVSFDYASESDKGLYPIPAKPLIEGGSDRHMLLIDAGTCTLYELYAAQHTSAGWHAGSGAIWNLRSNALRPDGWTSADAAGLPIFPGLVRYDEVARGLIDHALRFTADRTARAHLYPARHDAGESGTGLPPMGLRLRLKSGVDISWAGPQTRVILTALKKYGMILADNGTSWYISGAPDPHWNDNELHQLNRISGADFEVVDTARLRNGK